MYELILPDLGEGVHEGEILKWHVMPGDTIQEDEPLVDVETDKAAITIPSPKSGTIVSNAGGVGDTILVGSVLTVIDDGSGSEISPPTTTHETTVAISEAASLSGGNATATMVAPSSVSAVSTATTQAQIIAAPATRKLARELKIDIKSITPTGPAGRVTSDDVQKFANSGSAVATLDAAPQSISQTATGSTSDHNTTPSGIPFLSVDPLPDFTQWGEVKVEAFRSIRRKVAKKMVTSMVLVPHVAHMDEADVTDLDKLRKQEKSARVGEPGGKLTLLPFVIRAVVEGLKAYPAFNASLDPVREELIYKKYYNTAIAVDTERGLVVPVIRDADRKSILQISKDIESIAGKARDNTLEANDFMGSSFTITNVGALGGLATVPTINYPDVAILAMGKIHEKPVVIDGEIVIRTVLPITLAFDHRVADGADAARFVNDIVRRLSNPSTLLIET